MFDQWVIYSTVYEMFLRNAYDSREEVPRVVFYNHTMVCGCVSWYEMVKVKKKYNREAV
jgi:hypothetical protein